MLFYISEGQCHFSLPFKLSPFFLCHPNYLYLFSSSMQVNVKDFPIAAGDRTQTVCIHVCICHVCELETESQGKKSVSQHTDSHYLIQTLKNNAEKTLQKQGNNIFYPIIEFLQYIKNSLQLFWVFYDSKCCVLDWLLGNCEHFQQFLN